MGGGWFGCTKISKNREAASLFFCIFIFVVGIPDLLTLVFLPSSFLPSSFLSLSSSFLSLSFSLFLIYTERWRARTCA